MLKHVQASQSMFRHAKACSGMLKHVQACFSMPDIPVKIVRMLDSHFKHNLTLKSQVV